MSNVHRHMLNVYNGIYVGAISLAIHMLIGLYTGIPYMYGFLVVLILLMAIGFEYISYINQGVRRTIIKYTLAVCIFFAGIGVIHYRVIITVMSALLITFICKILQRIRYISVIFACCLIIFIIVARILGEVIDIEIFMLALYIFIMSMCGIGKDVHYIFMTPVIMIFCLILYFVPTGNEPMSWNKVWQVIDAAGSTISDIWSDVVKITGLDKFGGKVKIGGYSDADKIDIVDEIEDNNKTQLTVAGRQYASCTYLRGSYYNIYDGEGWKKEYIDEEYPEYEVMLFETLNNILNYGTDKNKYIINNVSEIKVKYKELNTDNIFMPYNVMRSEMTSDYGYDNGVLSFSKMQREDDYYKVWYLDVNDNSLLKIYENHEEQEYKSANEIVNTADAYADYKFIDNLDNISLERMDELLKHRKEYVENNYMDIPDCVPKRVYDLAEYISQDAGSDYEKVENIVKYLNRYFRYNKKVTKTFDADDKNKCSVATFLFETKEGSCMHYASALAIMARCIGLPSRITTGYCIKNNGNSGEWVEHSVTGGEAHAWTEVYMGVKGWIRFDATPAYNANFSSGQNNNNRYNSTEAVDNSSVMTSQPVSGTSYTVASKTPSTPDVYVVAGKNDYNGGKSTATPGKNDGADYKKSDKDSFIFKIIVICCIIMAICILCICQQYYMKRKYYKNSDDAEKCSIIIDEIIHRYIRDMKKTGERACLYNCTLNESVRIMSVWLGDEKDNYEQLINAYQGKIFGDIRIDNNTVRQAEFLLARLRKRKYKNEK